MFQGVRGEGGGEGDAVFVGLDFDRVGELADGGVLGGAGGGLLGELEIAEEVEELVERLGGLAGVGFGWGDFVDAELDAGGIAEAGDEGGIRGQRKLETEDTNVAVSTKGRAMWPTAQAGAKAGTSLKRASRRDEPAKGLAPARWRSRMEWICSGVGMLDAATTS